MIDDIPEVLQRYHQWVVWRADKHPRNARTMKHASVEDPTTWSSFEEARSTVEQGKALGVGFVFTGEDPFVAIDFDKVIEGDTLDSWVSQIIEQMDSYTEVSQSGRGIHIIVKGKKPGERCRNKKIEIYDDHRYFALTGDIYEGRAAINKRQDALDRLVKESFEAEGATVIADVGDLSLDPDAEPPKAKLKALLKKKAFRELWELNSDLESLSDYDWAITRLAYEAEWEDQEIADLIIAFRRENGEPKDLKKALRGDYISRTIGKVKGEDSTTGLLSLLPFGIERIVQYGDAESSYKLILDNGTEMDIDSTEALFSVRKMAHKFFEKQIIMPKGVQKKWPNILQELIPKIEVQTTTSKHEDFLDKVNELISTRTDFPIGDTKGELKQIFEDSANSIALSSTGRVFLKLDAIKNYYRSKSDTQVNSPTVARYLANIGFAKRGLEINQNGNRLVLHLWVSPENFFQPPAEITE